MRSYLLWKISQQLERVGVEEIRSVPEFRKLYPGVDLFYSKLTNAALQEILEKLEKGEPIAPSIAPHGNRKSKLSDGEIRRRRESGESLGSIAKDAGVSISRIGQICEPKIKI
jgi:lysophospholipid acyltransferase (LPLAT)-like uncharacterized protein